MKLYTKENKSSNLTSATLIGTSFTQEDVRKVSSCIGEFEFIVSLPEVGSIAISCKEQLHDGKLVFHEVHSNNSL